MKTYLWDKKKADYFLCFFLLLEFIIGQATSLNDGDNKEEQDKDNQGTESNLGALKYVWGDALSNPQATGPDGEPYPWEYASKIAGKQRIPRSLLLEGDSSVPPPLLSPEETRKLLLRSFEDQQQWEGQSQNQGSSYLMRNSNHKRTGRSKKTEKDNENNQTPPDSFSSSSGGDGGGGFGGGCIPARLCQSTYNTTAPMYGISLTSGQPVTIVQKFPDLLQQVVYQVCTSEECDIIHGQCVQTYLPYLFLVIPLGPVTLTGQDYVLVESGCACRPKYAKKQDDPPPFPFIQSYNQSKQQRTNKRF